MNKFCHDIKVIVILFFLMVSSFRSALWIVQELQGFPKTSSKSVPGSVAQAGPGHVMRVSAYCPGSCCTGKWADGYTSSGVPAVGLIVAAPSDTKFGTVLEIPGYGRATVQDRGGAITGNRLDVLFATHEEAKKWGVKYLMVREVAP